MRIAIFSTQIGTGGTGPEVIDRNLVRELSRIDGRNRYDVYCVSEEGAGSLRLEGPNVDVHCLRPSNKWAAVSYGMSRELRRRPADLLHGTFVPPLQVRLPLVFTLVCWAPFDYPECYPFGVRMRLRFLWDRGIRKAAGIVCISNFIRERLLGRFPVDPGRVFLSFPGVSPDFHRIPDREDVRLKLERFGIRGPYLLFPSSLTKRKNPEGALRAFHMLRREEKIPHKLVMIGPRTWLGKHIEPLIGELGLQSDVVFAPCRHEEVPLLYNGADVMVFPSYYEGFGMPPLESMACGTPVVTSNVSAVPEVVGDAAVLVDPKRPEEIAGGILRLLKDGPFRKELIGKGYARAAEFTWERTARMALEAYERSAERG